MADQRLEILFVTANPPSPIRVRPYQLIRALARRGHGITLATPCAGARERADAQALREQGIVVITHPLGALRRARNLAMAWFSGLPLQSRYAWHPDLMSRLEATTRRPAAGGAPFDVAHVEHLRASQYALRLRPCLPVVWDSVDSITELFAQARAHTRSRRGRLISTIDLERTRRCEGWLAASFDGVVVSSEHDRAALEALRRSHVDREPPHDRRFNREAATPGGSDAGGGAAGSPITVVPNGVDLSYFAPSDQPREPETILFSGKLSYHANVTAARHLVDDVMPRVWARRPAARVVLAGAEPSRELLHLAARHPGRVAVTGYVADLRPWLWRATLATAPMVYAVGIQNKVLEALATSTPVVATPIALRSLGARTEREVLAAADPAAFAGAILDLIEDPTRAAALGRAGRAYALRCHSWDAAAARLEGVYRAAIDARRSHRSSPCRASLS